MESTGWRKWWVYQRERFPVFAHGALIAAFSSSGVSYSALLRGAWPRWPSLLVAFVTSFGFFLQLRIADEFKDFEEDARYRPYRPVPRGLVKLRELGALFGIVAGVQLGLALWLVPRLAIWLGVVWVYLALMSREFFVRDWLKARPFTYMWSHMLIMPLIDLYATACDWASASAIPPRGLALFLWVSFFNGMVVEIGRKIRAPEDEEVGVDTYSVVWGRQRAVGAWLSAMALTALFAILASRHIGFFQPASWILAVLGAAGAAVALRYLRRPLSGRAKMIEAMSGIWTLMMYLSLGAIPAVWKLCR